MMTSKKTSVKRRSPAGAKIVSSPPPDWDALFQVIPDPAMILGPDFSILHVNRAAQQATGLLEQELKGRPCYEIFHDASRPPQGCPLAEVIASGRGGTAELEVEILKGAYRVACAPMLDENGRIQNFIHLASDITGRKKLAQALRVSEEKFRTIADFTYDWEVWLDAQQQLVYVSPACERVSGYRPQEFMDDPALMGRIVHPDDRAIWEQHLLRHCKGDGPDNLDETVFRILRRDGETRWIEHACRTVHGTDGKYLGRRSSNRDITERKQAEEALKKKDEFIEAMLQSSAVATFVINAEHRVIYWNRACEDLTGVKAADLIGGSHHWKAFYDHPRPCVADIIVDNKLDDMGRFYNTHARSALIPNGVSAEGWYPNPGGQNRYIMFDAAPIYDKNGKLIAAIETLNDITERKQIEIELRESEEKYRRLVELSPDLIAVHSEGKICFANQAGLRLVGADRLDQMVGKPILEFVAPGLRAQIAKRIQHALQNGAVLPFLDEKFVRLDGSEVDVSVTAVPTAWQGKPAMQVIARDITEHKLAEEELRRAKEALETALAREKELSHTDFLTSVNNRRHLYERAEHEFEVAARYQQPLSVMMFDIDHFKDVNDTFGHAVGDQILRSIAQIARAELRSVDVIGRYGGEEFIILLPMTNAEQAHPVAERIRAGVAGLRVPTPKGDASATLSIGIVEMNHTAPAESVEGIFRRADIAMYAAKQAGRNCIVISN